MGAACDVIASAFRFSARTARKAGAGVTTTVLQATTTQEPPDAAAEARDAMTKSRMSHRSKAESHVSKKSQRSGGSNDSAKRVQSG